MKIVSRQSIVSNHYFNIQAQNINSFVLNVLKKQLNTQNELMKEIIVFQKDICDKDRFLKKIGMGFFQTLNQGTKSNLYVMFTLSGVT